VLLVMAISYFLILAYGAKVVGLELMIGAYAAGVAFASHPERNHVEEDIKPLCELLTPLFFILLGASMEFSGLDPFSEAGRQSWGFAALLFVADVVGKLFAPFFIPGNGMNKWAVGSGIMPRGEVGLIFAQMGLMSGSFSSELFSSFVVVIIATTMVGPVLLRVSWRA